MPIPRVDMLLESLPRAALCVLAGYVCFYAPGHGLVPRRSSGVPTAFARVLSSAIVSTLLGTALAAAEQFSLAALLTSSAAVAGVALLARRALADQEADGEAASATRDLLGPLLFLLALGAYWPPYPSFLSASDSTVYVAAGVSLAHHGTLAREDDLGPQVPPDLRPLLFDTMTQEVGSDGPPYRRMPGGIVIDSLDATRAWPAFFPVPSVWAATFVLASQDDETAPGYAPVFAALAVWAFWLLARAWMGTVHALAAVVLLAASMPFYLNARSSLSESIAAFFAISGLAVLARGGASANRRDAILAGAAFGAAIFTRIEIALMLALAFALYPSMDPSVNEASETNDVSRRRRRDFVTALVAVALLTVVQAATVPGTYVTPLIEHAQNAWSWTAYPWAFLLWCLGQRMTQPIPAVLAGYAVVIVAVAAFAVGRVGWSATLRWGFVLAIVLGHAMAAPFEVARTPMWLSLSIGGSSLLLALAGALLAWRGRSLLPAAPAVLSILAAVSLILFYNPHVYPELSWGTRRFVPLLVPLIVLLACYAIARVSARSRLLAIVLLAVMAAQVAVAGRPIWGRDLLQGTHETLERLNAAIPTDGTIFVDRQISALMIGPALWLMHDRNSITVPPTTGPGASQCYASLMPAFSGKGPVYLVTQGRSSQRRIPFVRMTLVAKEAVGFPYLEGTYDRRPEKVLRSVRLIGVYRLESVPDPRGALVE